MAALVPWEPLVCCRFTIEKPEDGDQWGNLLTSPNGSITWEPLILLYCRFSIEEQEDGEQWGNLLTSSNGSITWEPLIFYIVGSALRNRRMRSSEAMC
jgi:hypothetical protein